MKMIDIEPRRRGLLQLGIICLRRRRGAAGMNLLLSSASWWVFSPNMFEWFHTWKMKKVRQCDDACLFNLGWSMQTTSILARV